MKLLYFSKRHCTPCAFTKPAVQALSAAHNLDLTLVDCSPGRDADVDALIAQYGIRSVPVLVVLTDAGEVQETMIGSAINAASLSKLVSA